MKKATQPQPEHHHHRRRAASESAGKADQPTDARFVDNRPEAVAQRALDADIHDSPN